MKKFAPPYLIVALDFFSRAETLAFVKQIDPQTCRLKIGFQLFVACGPSIIEELMNLGFSIFLDLKFLDIPNTVAQACRAAASLGVWMVNVHVTGGSEMLTQARQALDTSSQQPLLIGVTLLTSFDEAAIKAIGFSKNIKEMVIELAGLAKKCGLDGVVCSSHEATILRAQYEQDFCLVAPGIRNVGDDHKDQQRVMTPSQAIAAGVNYIVVGRPITQARDPYSVIQQINMDIMKQAV